MPLGNGVPFQVTSPETSTKSLDGAQPTIVATTARKQRDGRVTGAKLSLEIGRITMELFEQELAEGTEEANDE
jgi:hypothetical protein